MAHKYGRQKTPAWAKALIFAFIILFGAMMYMGTRGPGREALLGTWTNKNTSLVFKSDGTWVSHAKDQPAALMIWGTYRLNGTDEIIMNYSSPPYPAMQHIHKIELSHSVLKLQIHGDNMREFRKGGA